MTKFSKFTRKVRSINTNVIFILILFQKDLITIRSWIKYKLRVSISNRVKFGILFLWIVNIKFFLNIIFSKFFAINFNFKMS